MENGVVAMVGGGEGGGGDGRGGGGSGGVGSERRGQQSRWPSVSTRVTVTSALPIAPSTEYTYTIFTHTSIHMHTSHTYTY